MKSVWNGKNKKILFAISCMAMMENLRYFNDTILKKTYGCLIYDWNGTSQLQKNLNIL